MALGGADPSEQEQEDGPGPIAIIAPSGRDAQVISDTLNRHRVAGAVLSAQEVLDGICDGSLAGALIAHEALPVLESRLEQAIAAQPPWSDFPFVILTLRGEPPGKRARPLQNLGNVTLLERPLQTSGLVAAARAIVRARSRQRQTERFLAAQAAAHANLQALNDLRALFENAPGLIFMTEGASHDFCMANATFRGLVRRPVLGKAFSEALPELEEQGFRESLDQVLASAEPIVGREVALHLHPPGHPPQTHSVTFVLQPVIGPSGDVQGVFAEGIDVTNQKLSREKLETLQSELIHMSRLSAMGAMASTLAHELNQPLTAIASYLRASRRLLAMGQADDIEDVRRALESAEQNAMRAGEIIRRTREMVVSGAVAQDPVDLAKLVRESLDLALVGNLREQLVCETQLTPGIMVVADRIQIQQVLLNLIRNAVEAMHNCPERNLTVATGKEGQSAVVTVTDSGKGLDPAIRARLFTAFVTSKEDGMGVGLSISRTIIEAHGGSITATEDPSGGTTFRFTLPIYGEA